jgi:hypothetical protein
MAPFQGIDTIHQLFCGHAMQRFDIVECLHHMLARHPVL